MKTLLSLFNEARAQYGPLPFLLMRPRFRLVRLTFNEVDSTARSYASLLALHGVSYQDRVILIAPSSPYWGCAFLGILMRGAIVVPLNPLSSSDFIDRVIAETQARVVLKSSAFSFTTTHALKVIDIDNLDMLKKSAPLRQEPPLKPEDIAEIVYTSGTTGEPKGVVLSHANIVSNVEAITHIFQATPNDRAVSILPLFHVFEQIIGFLGAMQFGVSVFYASNVSSRALMKALQEHKATKNDGSS